MCALLAIALAWPVPPALAAARWPARYPVAAVVLWQAIGLSGGLALLTAELTLAGVHQPQPWSTAVVTALRRREGLGFLGWLGLVAFLLTALWLLGVLARSTARVISGRRRHRYLLDLLGSQGTSSRSARLPADVFVLAHPQPAAYSIPGIRPRIVVSDGAVAAFAPQELDAVVDHERAHLRQHHDILVQPFLSWQRSFPFLPAASRALEAVELLAESLADDVALHEHGRAPLVSALQTVQGQGPELNARCARLHSESAGASRRWLATVIAGLLGASLVLLPPAVLLLTR